MTNIPLPDLGKFRKELDGLKPQLDKLEEIQASAFRAYRLVCDLEERPRDFQELRRKAQEQVEVTAQDSAQVHRLIVEGQRLADHLAGLEAVRQALEAVLGEIPERRSDIMSKLRGLTLDRMTMRDAALRAQATAQSDYPCRRQWVAKLSTRLNTEQAKLDRDYRSAVAGLVLFEELAVAKAATSEALERAAKDSRLLKMIRRAHNTRSTPLRSE